MTIKYVQRTKEGGIFEDVKFYYHFKVQVADDKNFWPVVLNEKETAELYAALSSALGYEHGETSREWRRKASENHERMIDQIERRTKKILKLIGREPEPCCYCSED